MQLSNVQAKREKPIIYLVRTIAGSHKHLGISRQGAGKQISGGDFAIGSKNWNEPPDLGEKSDVRTFPALRFHTGIPWGFLQCSLGKQPVAWRRKRTKSSMVHPRGLEPLTSTVSRWRSTTKLRVPTHQLQPAGLARNRHGAEKIRFAATRGNQKKIGITRMATMLTTLIIGLMAGPAVSL